MTRSLQTRLWLTYVVLIVSVLTAVATGMVIYLLRNPAPVRQAGLIINTAANILQNSGRLRWISGNTNLPDTVLGADQNLNIRIAIFDPQGKIIADSRSESEAYLPDLPFLRDKLQSSSRTYALFRDQNRKLWLYTLRTLPDNNILVVSTARPAFRFNQLTREEFFQPFLLTALFALLLSVIFAWWITRWISQPLQNIAQATRQISSGQNPLLPLEGPDEVKGLAQKFNEMATQVQASQKSQRDFIANVSHDLKTPLTSIQGYAQAIQDGTANSPEALQNAADVIYNESSRMYRMVTELLDLARLDSGMIKFAKEIVNIPTLLEKIISQLTLQAGQKNINLSCEISPLPDIIGDSDRLNQAISNLVENALKFTPTNGKVTILAQHIADKLEVSVSDTGPGISTQDMPYIFDRFYQADKSRSTPLRGTGLGLTIAQQIIRAHNGTIVAYNNLADRIADKSTKVDSSWGCTFLVTIPIVNQHANPATGKNIPVKNI
jgi:signal transduction histidine kinase